MTQNFSTSWAQGFAELLFIKTALVEQLLKWGINSVLYRHNQCEQ
jgi:hypothetical protein